MSHNEGGRTKLVATFFECCIGPGLPRPPKLPSKLPRGLGGVLLLSCLLKSLLLPCLFNPPPIPPMPLPKISWSKLSLRYHKKMSLEWFPTGDQCRTRKKQRERPPTGTEEIQRRKENSKQATSATATQGPNKTTTLHHPQDVVPDKLCMGSVNLNPAKGGKCILSFKFLARPLVIAMFNTGLGSRQFLRIHK